MIGESGQRAERAPDHDPVQLIRFDKSDPGYPQRLDTYLGEQAPSSISAIGDLQIVSRPTVGLFSSVHIPGGLIVQMYDLAQRLRQSSVVVVGGFHSPMERECLSALLRGPQPVVACPARRLIDRRLPLEYRDALQAGRLLLLSPFAEPERRATAETAQERNRFVAALADSILIAYAEPGGRTERFWRDIQAWGKPLYTLENNANAGLIALGASPVGRELPVEWAGSSDQAPHPARSDQ